MKPKVYITRIIPERGLNKIKEYFDVEIWTEVAPPPKEVIIEKVRDKDALVPLLTDKIDAEVMDAGPNLKIISQYAVGYDNIDVKEATKRGICVTNTPGVLTETVADFTMALMLSVARRVVEADKYIRSGKWKVGWHPTMLLGQDVYNRTLGIIGLGRIGRAVAVRAKGFNMKIMYYDVYRNEEFEKKYGLEYATIDEILKKSDFVTLHVPLTEKTYHLIGERELKMMKPTAILINTSRGKVVDQNALYKALKEGWIYAAAIDVFEEEPTPLDNPLLKLDNFIGTPHIASASIETRSRMAEIVADNLIAFFEGRKPPNLVNEEVWKK